MQTFVLLISDRLYAEVNIMLSVNLSTMNDNWKFSDRFSRWNMLTLVKSMRSHHHHHSNTHTHSQFGKCKTETLFISFFCTLLTAMKQKICLSKWYICYNHDIQYNLTDTFLIPLKTFQLAAAHSEAENQTSTFQWKAAKNQGNAKQLTIHISHRTRANEKHHTHTHTRARRKQKRIILHYENRRSKKLHRISWSPHLIFIIFPAASSTSIWCVFRYSSWFIYRLYTKFDASIAG